MEQINTESVKSKRQSNLYEWRLLLVLIRVTLHTSQSNKQCLKLTLQLRWYNVSHLKTNKYVNQIYWTWLVCDCVNVSTCMRPQRKVICTATSTLAESPSTWLPSTPLLCNSTSAVTVPIIMAKKAKVPVKHKHAHGGLPSKSTL